MRFFNRVEQKAEKPLSEDIKLLCMSQKIEDRIIREFKEISNRSMFKEARFIYRSGNVFRFEIKSSVIEQSEIDAITEHFNPCRYKLFSSQDYKGSGIHDNTFYIDLYLEGIECPK